MEGCVACIELSKTLEQCKRELEIVKRQLQQYQSSQITSYHERRRQALGQYKLEYEEQNGCSLPLEPTHSHTPMEWEDVIDGKVVLQTCNCNRESEQ